jgi:Domain of unknown function (DUF4349)
MPHIIKNHQWTTFFLLGLVILVVLVAGCGAGTAGTTTSTGSNNASIPASSNANQQKSAAPGGTQQYLIKSLNITMELKDTQRSANDLQSWMSTTDPLSTAENINYEQVGDNLYNISMTFSVQAALYPRIESYLNNYPALHKGRLISTTKSTQDVSGDYVDTQSRLKNLRGEQTRLLTLLSHASVLGDILAIDQRLTDVEGQIEQIEAHLNQLNGQVSFYTIAISLQPAQAVLTPPPAPWSLAKIWQDALGAAGAFGQVLATFVIWLAVFSVYIIPLLLIVWLVLRWRRLRTGRPIPATASNVTLPKSGETA